MPRPPAASKRPARDSEMDRLVALDGLTVRRRRHDHGWSPRDLVVAIENASFISSGLRRTLTPNQIEAIEERAERISYASLLLLADGLDCDPVDLMATPVSSGPSGSRRSSGSSDASETQKIRRSRRDSSLDG